MNEIWKAAAIKLGWKWSEAHGGYVNESHRNPGMGWDSYRVAVDAEEACDHCGVETLEAAAALVEQDG